MLVFGQKHKNGNLATIKSVLWKATNCIGLNWTSGLGLFKCVQLYCYYIIFILTNCIGLQLDIRPGIIQMCATILLLYFVPNPTYNFTFRSADWSAE